MLAALCSVICPGLGQLVQGRFFEAVAFFAIAVVIGVLSWVFVLAGFLSLGGGGDAPGLRPDVSNDAYLWIVLGVLAPLAPWLASVLDAARWSRGEQRSSKDNQEWVPKNAFGRPLQNKD